MEDTIKVSLAFDSRQWNTSSPDPKDRWDRASTCKSWKFEGLRRERDGKNPNWRGSDVFEIPKAWAGKDVFVVWMEWSTGDSFGHDENAYAEGIGVYATYEEARDVKKLIMDDYKKERDYQHKSYNANQITLPSGQKLYTGTWKGYFESLEEVHISDTPVPSRVDD